MDNPSPSPTSTPIINKVNPDLGNKNPLDSRPGLIKKEALQGNATKYTFNSGQADHPNIIITNSNNNIVFQSTITDPSLPIKISDYTESYGQPKFIFIGTKSYGSQSRIYIYAELGIAFIADPQTGNVLEQQVFNPTKVDDYVRNYGQDIQAQP
ncbi:MAG TPA: hypothetical protein VLG67_01790 [Candidatus Saccharimonadales bacterium]|nr:hypothetical protein [Candidatus Saccharimonadales bacterium]